MRWYRGRHNITAGGDFRREEFNYLQQTDPRGTFTFTGAALGSDFADFAQGVPDTAAANYGNADKYLRHGVYDAYIADDWRLRPELTLNLGVRWEYGAPLTELKQRLVNLDVLSGYTAVAQVLASDPIGSLTGQHYPISLLRPDRSRFEPRIGLAWRPLAGSSLVVRSGYGIYSDTSVYQATTLALATQSPFATSLQVNNADCAQTLRTGPTACSGTTTNTFAVDPNYRVGYAQTWNLSAQRDLPGALVATISYLGIKGTRGVQDFLPNTYPIGGVNPCPSCPVGFEYRATNGNSTRNAGTVQLRRRLRSGLTAGVDYTYSRSVDDDSMLGGQGATAPANTASSTASSGSESTGSIAQDWRNLRAERGLSTFDQRHLVNATAQYTTGMGAHGGTLLSGWRGRTYKEWTVAAQASFGSGLPETPVYLAAVNGTGFTGSIRPDRVSGMNAYAGGSGHFFNVAAFTAPQTGQWGSAGRDSLRGPGTYTFNTSLSRTFRIKKRFNLDVRADAFNLLTFFNKLLEEDTAEYLSRMSASFPVSTDAAHALKDLREFELLVLSPPGPLRNCMQSTLRDTGFGKLRFADHEQLLGLFADTAMKGRPLLILAVRDGSWSGDEGKILDDLCATHDIRWLHVSVGSNEILLGPMFSRGLLACFDCFVEACPQTLREHGASAYSLPMAAMTAGIMATELAHLSSGVGRLFTGDGYAVLAADGGLIERGRVPIRLNCPQCDAAPLTAGKENVAANALRVNWFEQKVQTIDRDWASRAVLPAAAGTPTMKSRVFSNSQRIRMARMLPPLQDGLLGLLYQRFRRGHKPRFCDLPPLLILSAGIRPQRARGMGHVKYWCANGGNLGSVQACIVVRDVEGIKPGVYVYDSDKHELIITGRQVSISFLLPRLAYSKSEDMPAAVIALVGTFGKVRLKYGDFGYRLMHMDAGTATAQLLVAASATGIVAQAEPAWDAAELAPALRLGEDEELTQLISLWPNKASPLSVCSVSPYNISPAIYPVELSACMSSSDLLSALRSDPVSPRALPLEPSPGNVFQGEGPAIQLPSPELIGKTVGQVLRRRRSVRTFNASPVTLKEISTMLTAATRGDAEDWNALAANTPVLRCIVFVRHVAGLYPGIYLYDVAQHSLYLYGALPPDEDYKELFVQEELTQAPLILWVEGDLKAAAAQRGFAGYRQMMVRAGCYANRLWLAGLALEVQGVLVAGLVHAQARQQLGLGVQGYSGLLALVAGHSTTQDAPEDAIEFESFRGDSER